MVARLALVASLVIAGVARAPQSEQDLVARARGIHERVTADCGLRIADSGLSIERPIRNP